MKPLVYLAGPISKPCPLENANKAFKLATALVDEGVVIPFVPHCSVAWQMVTPQAWEWWLQYDLQVIERCDALLRLHGESRGADWEVDHATKLGIPVFHTTLDLYNWATGGQYSD